MYTAAFFWYLLLIFSGLLESVVGEAVPNNYSVPSIFTKSPSNIKSPLYSQSQTPTPVATPAWKGISSTRGPKPSPFTSSKPRDPPYTTAAPPPPPADSPDCDRYQCNIFYQVSNSSRLEDNEKITVISTFMYCIGLRNLPHITTPLVLRTTHHQMTRNQTYLTCRMPMLPDMLQC